MEECMIHLLTGCSPHHHYLYQTDPDALDLARRPMAYPRARFLVFSDPHHYDPSLGTTGTAFQAYLDRDRKLLALSDEIIGTAVDKMAATAADFVLVCGDLTKDGEMVCHRRMVEYLKRLKDSGKQVYVVPGNHDVSNHKAVRFVGDHTEPVPHAGPEDFQRLYGEFGYNGSLARDSHSLSYLAEPVDGLWLLALDSCRWKENRPGHRSITAGAVSRETLVWAEAQLVAAKQQNKAVIVFLHHGVMEHYPANKRFYGEYLVENDRDVSELLAAYGVSLVFTGHFHAQDITAKSGETHTLFDIETGSLATAPCPWREVELESGKSGNLARIRSHFVREIPSMGPEFGPYSDDYVFRGTQKMADAALDKYLVSTEQRDLIKHQVARAYMGHLKGDEVVPPAGLDTSGFRPWLRIIAWMQEALIEGWQTDFSPRDNEVIIHLDTGEVSPLS